MKPMLKMILAAFLYGVLNTISLKTFFEINDVIGMLIVYLYLDTSFKETK